MNNFAIMNILVATNHLQFTGGTETYTFALAVELMRQGYDVEYFAFDRGESSKLLEAAGVPYMSRKKYDLILANHKPVVNYLQACGYIIQTCHGTCHALEQPSRFADDYVAVTEEIREYLMNKGITASVIHNGVDCNRFCPQNRINDKLSSVLSLCQSDAANEFIADCCRELGVSFISCNKYTDNVWEIEDKINQVDMVVGIGRSLYDSMACGRCVLSYDNRDYIDQAIGDGYLNADNFDRALIHNCSGRACRRTFTREEFIDELKKYNPCDGDWAREIALEKLNIIKVAQTYLSIYQENAGRQGRWFWIRCRKYFRSVFLWFKVPARFIRDSLRIVRRRIAS